MSARTLFNTLAILSALVAIAGTGFAIGVGSPTACVGTAQITLCDVSASRTDGYLLVLGVLVVVLAIVLFRRWREGR